MANRTITLNDTLYDYLLTVAVHEHPVQQALRARTLALGNIAKMQIAPEQGEFMRLLVELLGVKHALEIGVFTGYSALSVALSLPPDGKLIALDANKEWTDIAKEYWQKAGVLERIDFRLGDATQSLEALLAEGTETFDWIFIDADKTNYPHYYEQSLQLLRVGGLLLIDNMLAYGQVADPTDISLRTATIRELNQQIYQDSRVHMTLLPIADGLLLARKLA